MATTRPRDTRKATKGGAKRATARPAPPVSSAGKKAAARERKPAARPSVPTAAQLKRVARPDALDLRDRPFRPMVSITPALERFVDVALPLKHQGETNACTGFALSTVVEYLLRKSGRDPKARISPFMLYSMARRYDEFAGSVRDDGSSARGALKGWFKHGACREALFAELDMPPASKSLDEDWWFDAVRRPLGAYYRIDPRDIADMHAALNEVGILYVTAGCHSGWDEGFAVKPLKTAPRNFKNLWRIPVQGGQAEHAGHAFVIVGYCEDGFLIQNSWGEGWGSHGLAVLGYGDWIANAMDCWVVQLGVVTAEHRALASTMTLRTDAATGKVQLAASEVLRDREIAPFIINMGNNGALSNAGTFRTQPDDVRAIVEVQLPMARQRWGLKDDEPIDVCVYAHGGLVGERAAAQIAARWVPKLYDARIFPIFLMWETDAVSTCLNRLVDAVRDVPRTAGGFGQQMERWWNQRLERLAAKPGTQLWGEMKQNAEAISTYRDAVPDDAQAGAVLLWRHFQPKVQQQRVRLHLVGHSAGSIVASWMVDRLVGQGLPFASISFMAPAVRVDTFTRLVVPHLQSGQVERFQTFHLSDQAEQDDATCGPYKRSLLYLVRESFEGGSTVPILGLEVDFDRLVRPLLPKAVSHVAPGPTSLSVSHGGFDDDEPTLAHVLSFIKGA